MASLLRDLLLDTRKRSENLLRELDALKAKLPGDVESFRDRWAGLVQTCRGTVDALLSDPDLQNPQLASNFYISYKSVMQFLFEAEAGPLVVLSRFKESDLFLTRVLARLCNEIGYPDPAPLGSAGSSQLYGALPNVDIVIVPPLEGHHLLGLADLYHELAHFLLRRRAAQLIAPFQSVIDSVVDELIEDARRRNATAAELESIKANRTAWKRSWHEEFAADMMATLSVGPAFGWANVRLCTNMSSTLFSGGRSHPADAARHRGVDLMLRRLGYGNDAERIDGWWQELVGLAKDTMPNDFDLTYPPTLLEALCDFVHEECSKTGLVPWSQQDVSKSPHIGQILNQAWDMFRKSPATFGDYERTTIETLRSTLGI